MVQFRWASVAILVVSAAMDVTSAQAQSAGASVAGRSVAFPQVGASASYLPNGRYVFTSRAGRESGKWARNGDTLCIQFNNGVSRCDTYFFRGGQLFMRNSQGQVFAGRIR